MVHARLEFLQLALVLGLPQRHVAHDRSTGGELKKQWATQGLASHEEVETLVKGRALWRERHFLSDLRSSGRVTWQLATYMSKQERKRCLAGSGTRNADTSGQMLSPRREARRKGKTGAFE